MTDEQNSSPAKAASVSSASEMPASREEWTRTVQNILLAAFEHRECDHAIIRGKAAMVADGLSAALANQPAPASREALTDACDVACTYLEEGGKKAHAIAAIELRDAVRVALANTPDGWRESYAPLVIEARRLACAVRAEAVPALRDTGVNMSLADDLERFAALVSAALPQPPEMK